MIAETIEANGQTVTLARLVLTEDRNQVDSRARACSWTLTARDVELQVLHRLKEKGFDWSESLRDFRSHEHN